MSHPPILETRQTQWPDEAACASFAARWAGSNALRDASLEIDGPLGAGKTTFVRHLLRALGVQGRIKSPTYAVMEPYTLDLDTQPLAISHFDFYRFNDPREWEDAGFRDVFAAPGLKLSEWADKAAGMLPCPDVRLHIEPVDETQRHVVLQAFTPRGVTLLQEALA